MWSNEMARRGTDNDYMKFDKLRPLGQYQIQNVMMMTKVVTLKSKQYGAMHPSAQPEMKKRGTKATFT